MSMYTTLDHLALPSIIRSSILADRDAWAMVLAAVFNYQDWRMEKEKTNGMICQEFPLKMFCFLKM